MFTPQPNKYKQEETTRKSNISSKVKIKKKIPLKRQTGFISPSYHIYQLLNVLKSFALCQISHQFWVRVVYLLLVHFVQFAARPLLCHKSAYNCISTKWSDTKREEKRQRNNIFRFHVVTCFVFRFCHVHSCSLRQHNVSLHSSVIHFGSLVFVYKQSPFYLDFYIYLFVSLVRSRFFFFLLVDVLFFFH